MEFIPGFLTVAKDNSTYNLENTFLGEESHYMIPLASMSTEEIHVSPRLVVKVDSEALFYVSLYFLVFFWTAVVITGAMFLWEHYRQFQLQKLFLSRPYFHGTPLQEVCSSLKVQCCIMLDDQFKFDCIQCPQGHWVGRDALQQHVAFEAQKPLNVTGGKIKCPLCDHHYDDQSLAFFCGPEAFQAYNKMRQTKVHQEEKENVLAEIEENARRTKEDAERKEREAERQIIQEAVRNQFKVGDGTYYGYMCPTCGFGPVDHMECDDLAAHHGEVKDHGIEIDNSCPMCLWYGTNKTQWGMWEGEFLEGEQLEATQKAVDQYKLPFEEFKKETLLRLKELKSQVIRAQYSKRFAMLQQIAPREFPETSVNVSYKEEAEDPEEIMFQMRRTYNNTLREALQTRLIKSMEGFRTKNVVSENNNCKLLKKEQDDLVQELRDRRESMQENIQEAVIALGYDIVVTHPPSEDSDEEYF